MWPTAMEKYKGIQLCKLAVPLWKAIGFKQKQLKDGEQPGIK